MSDWENFPTIKVQRGEEKTGSDIDIIVEFSKRKSLLKLVRIERELSEVLGIKVNLLTEKSISCTVCQDVAVSRLPTVVL